MKSRTLKFLVTDSAVTLLMLVVMSLNFSLMGLVGVLVFSGLLFLGTLLDKNKSWLGVANKSAYILFCILMGLFMVLEGRLMDMGYVNMSITPTYDTAFIIAGVLMLLFFIPMAIISGNRTLSYAVCVPLRYAGLMLLMNALQSFLGHSPFPYMLLIDGFIVMFMMSDLFSSKLRVDRFGVEQGKLFDKGYWMAFGVSWALLFSMATSGEFWYRVWGLDFMLTMRTLAGGAVVPVFVVVMLILSGVYLLADIRENTGNIFDSYLPCALAGFSTTLAMLGADCTVGGLIILILTAGALFAVGLWTVSLSHTTHPEEGVTLTVTRTLVTDIIGVSIGLAGMFSIFLIGKGYLEAVIAAAVMVTIVLISWRTIKGQWIADSIKWELILLTEFVFALTAALVDGRFVEVIAYHLLAFLIASLAVWGLGVRSEKGKLGLTLAARVFVSLVLGVFCVFSVIRFY